MSVAKESLTGLYLVYEPSFLPSWKLSHLHWLGFGRIYFFVAIGESALGFCGLLVKVGPPHL